MKVPIFFMVLIFVVSTISCTSTGDLSSENGTDNSTSMSSAVSQIGSAAFDMPVSISLSIPASVKTKAPAMLKSEGLLAASIQKTGAAYDWMERFVSWGITATEQIDFILSNVGRHSNFFASNIGKKVTNINTNGLWVFYNTKASNSYYLYYGETPEFTNLYIDWTKTDGRKYKGKAQWFNKNTNLSTELISKAVVYYDNASEKPYLDITLSPNTAGKPEWEKMRVMITRDASNSVQVQAKGFTTNSYTNLTADTKFKYWDLTGFAADNTNGGGHCQG